MTTTKKSKLIERLKKKKAQLDLEYNRPDISPNEILHNIEHIAGDIYAAACAAKQTKSK